MRASLEANGGEDRGEDRGAGSGGLRLALAAAFLFAAIGGLVQATRLVFRSTSPLEASDGRRLDAALFAGDEALFAEAGGVLSRADRRRAAHAAFLEAMGEDPEELPTDTESVSVTVGGRDYRFGSDGSCRYDERFVLPREVVAIRALEARYRQALGLPTPEGEGLLLTESPREAPVAALPPAVPSPRAPDTRRPAAPAAGARAKPKRLPVFRGYEASRYQRHDALIAATVAEFNANRRLWAGATPGQARAIPPLDPAWVKAQLIEESGGNDLASRAAWETDPMQVNVPGDWTAYKRYVGLKEPRHRNEGTIRVNLRAAVKYLVRKGFGVSGQPAANRADGSFDGWKTAVQRYNGRVDRTAGGKTYCREYADHVESRARHPHLYVPIAIQVKKKGGSR